MNKKFIEALIVLICFNCAQAQVPTPAKAQTKSILVTNVFIHIGNGKVIENGVIGLRNGKIDLVADATVIKLKSSSYDSIIQFNGEHAYPSFIAPNSTIGLNEIDAVRATADFNEVGVFNPHIRALIAFNADSKVSATVRTNGVLYAQATPRGGVISGKSSVMALDAWNWEDAVLLKDDGIHINFPESAKPTRRNSEQKEKEEKMSPFKKEMNELKKFFDDAKAFCNSTTIEEVNLRFEAMRSVFSGKQNVYVHASTAKDIIASVDFLKSYGIVKIVIVGGGDSYKITEYLKKNKVAVMINRTHSLPLREHDDIDMPFKLAYLLQKDSVSFCLNNAGDMEGMNARNIPFLAGTARAYGLTNEQAIASVSNSVAKIVGIDQWVGSIEEGKLASFFISTGDALDMRTNNVVLAFIQGKSIKLHNAQTELYDKYMKKYELKK